jgi:hypothetical protein
MGDAESMSGELRKRFYEHFARTANDSGIRWTVLSGIDGYPPGIGRDLDVACAGRDDADQLCKVFLSCLHEHTFRWIVYPSPIWGRRILGITQDYETVELHIVHPVRVGIVTLTPAWSAIEYVGGVFPSDPLARFFKRCLMPALVGGGGWQRKCAGTPMPDRLPWWMRSIARKVKSGRALGSLDRLALYSLYFIDSPARAVVGLVQWRVRRAIRRTYPAAPVYQLNGAIDPEAFLGLSQRLLSEVFTGFICIDDYSPKRVRAMQAAQRLVFLSKHRPDIRDIRAIPDGVQGSSELLEFVMGEFCSFNERWRPGGSVLR